MDNRRHNILQKVLVSEVIALKKNIEIPVWEKMTITKEEAAAYSNIGVNKIDELMRNPRCDFVIYIGKKRLIKRKKFEKFIDNNIEI